MTVAVQALRGVVASNRVPHDASRQTNVSRTKRRTSSAATAVTLMLGTLLVAGMPRAQGQGTAPEAKPAANPVSSAPAGTPTGASAQTGAQPGATAPASASAQTGAASQASAGAQPSAGKPAPVCFPLTGRCVEGAKATATKGSTSPASKAGSPARRPLNLTAPDVRTVVSADELKEPLPSNDQITETQEADTVSVKGEANLADVPLGLGAIWWALNHPSQAWRILTPE